MRVNVNYWHGQENAVFNQIVFRGSMVKKGKIVWFMPIFIFSFKYYIVRLGQKSMQFDVLKFNIKCFFDNSLIILSSVLIIFSVF